MALVLPNELLVKVLEETTDADRKRASQTSRLLRQLAPWTGCRQFADIQFMEEGGVFARVDWYTAYRFEKDNCLMQLAAFFKGAIAGTVSIYCPIDEQTKKTIGVVLRSITFTNLEVSLKDGESCNLALGLLGARSEIADARFRFDGDEVEEQERNRFLLALPARTTYTINCFPTSSPMISAETMVMIARKTSKLALFIGAGVQMDLPQLIQAFLSVDQIDHEVRFNVATELVYALLENLDPTWCERISKYAILDSQTNATLEFAPSSLGLSCITLKPKVFFQ